MEFKERPEPLKRKRDGREIAIKPSDIIRPNTEMITSLETLENIVKKRGPLFINKLENLAAKIAERVPGSMPGWESISLGENGVIGKIPARPDSTGALFTTNMLCVVAIYTLYEALRVKTSGLELQSVGIWTILDRENWKNHKAPLFVRRHTILQAREDQRKIYLDPTYRQIDHRFPGTIAVIQDYEFDEYYFDPENREPRPGEFRDALKIAEKYLGIRADDLQPLLNVFK